MEIGIITFWESTDNYGQVLQAYALQQVLKNMGHRPFQIRYSLKASQMSGNKSSIFRKALKAITVYPIIKTLIKIKKNQEDVIYRNMIEKKNIIRKFSDFREKYISYSEFVYNSIDEIRTNPPKADCYITGSDQVWTMLLNNKNNNAYFLDFGNQSIKRIAYAASFARNEYPNELIPLLKEQLAKFNAISVREDEGITLCKLAGRRDVIKTLDPTFLLSKEIYLDLVKNISIYHNYIYTYSINIRESNELAWNEVCKYACDRKLKLITTTSSGFLPGREILSDTKYVYATIPEWIAYINNAECILTTSFHGIAFCIILNKPFVYFPLKGNGSKGNGRVLSLLKELGLTDRIYSGVNLPVILDSKIDWTRVNLSIERLRMKSMDFLFTNLIQ